MRLPKTICLLTILAASFAFSAMPRTAHAQEYIPRTYKVQVQYWYFDSDYYYWSTVLETTDRNVAEFVYGLLLDAQEDGELNEAVASFNWRYIAVDVRMITDYNIPQFVLPNYYVSPTRATYFD